MGLAAKCIDRGVEIAPHVRYGEGQREDDAKRNRRLRANVSAHQFERQGNAQQHEHHIAQISINHYGQGDQKQRRSGHAPDHIEQHDGTDAGDE